MCKTTEFSNTQDISVGAEAPGNKTLLSWHKHCQKTKAVINGQVLPVTDCVADLGVMLSLIHI